MKCLVVVAHPDDEAIWMGGTILGHRSWEWHVLSLCRADDPDREPRFHRAAQAMGTREYISDLDDSPVLLLLSPDLSEMRERIGRLPDGEFDLIFTHGPEGEYTYHLRHAQAHRAVSEMIADGSLGGTLISFAYEDGGGAYFPRPAADARTRVELKPEEFAEKRRIVRDIYGFGPGSIEYESAGPVEAFGGNAQFSMLNS